MLSTFAFFAVVGLSTGGSAAAAGPGSGAAREPYLAVRTGLKCSACHVNRSGGGGRTAYGTVYAQTILPWRSHAVRNRAITEYLSVGFDLRAVGSGTVSASTPRTAVELEEAQAYLEARLIDRALALYVDQTLGPTRAVAREAFVLIERPVLNGYLKAGKFLLPYGWRLQDDFEYIRQQTGFSYDTPDLGVELGIEPGPFSWFVAVTNGTAGAAEGNDGKQVTSSAALTYRNFRVGASASHNEGAGRARRDVWGAFGGVGVGRLALLGEFDWIEDQPATGDATKQLAAYVEGDVLLAKGVNLKATYGWFDKSRTIPEDERVRARFGLEVFPVGFLRAAAFYTADIWIPQATTDIDRVSLELQLHF